jgi:hypothetical protein
LVFLSLLRACSACPRSHGATEGDPLVNETLRFADDIEKEFLDRVGRIVWCTALLSKLAPA